MTIASFLQSPVSEHTSNGTQPMLLNWICFTHKTNNSEERSALYQPWPTFLERFDWIYHTALEMWSLLLLDVDYNGESGVWKMGFLSKEYFRNEYREAIVTIQVLGKKALQYLPSIKGIFLTIREKSKVLKNLMAIVYTLFVWFGTQNNIQGLGMLCLFL